MAHSPSWSLEYEPQTQNGLTDSDIHEHLKGERRAFAITTSTRSITNGCEPSQVIAVKEHNDSDVPEAELLSGETIGGASTSQLSVNRYGFMGKDAEEHELSANDLKSLRQRELKWVSMTANLDTWKYLMHKEFSKVKNRCRKGIPASMRGKAWCFLSGALPYPKIRDSIVPLAQYNDIMRRIETDDHEMCNTLDDIRKDINRQFPEHELFCLQGVYGKIGQGELCTLLLAYALYNPTTGYCQGQGPIAATLLMHMPIEDAFYVFVQICDKYLPNYYAPGLQAVQIDGDTLFELLKSKSPLSHKHLKKQGVDPVLYMVEWFMCIFCRTLPWTTVLRIWDIFFCEGVKTLFKVAIVMFRYGLGTRQQINNHPTMFEVLERLRHLPKQIVQEQFMVEKMTQLKLDEEDLEKAHYKVLKRREKEKMKQQTLAHNSHTR